MGGLNYAMFVRVTEKKLVGGIFARGDKFIQKGEIYHIWKYFARKKFLLGKTFICHLDNIL